MYGENDWPSGTQIIVTISFIISVFITPILFFTGYGWTALHFLYGMPLGIFVACKLVNLFNAYMTECNFTPYPKRKCEYDCIDEIDCDVMHRLHTHHNKPLNCQGSDTADMRTGRCDYKPWSDVSPLEVKHKEAIKRIAELETFIETHGLEVPR